jgi:hypothetical protein
MAEQYPDGMIPPASDGRDEYDDTYTEDLGDDDYDDDLSAADDGLGGRGSLADRLVDAVDGLGDDDRPLDADLDDDRIDSAAADERAAREGTQGEVDDRP